MQRPRGTRDFAPAETAARETARRRMAQVFRRYGYQQVQTPTFEALELFTAKSGAAIEAELYAFEDKGGRALCLRPELTAPVMRLYFTDHAFDPKPVKWWYFGNCFRYDRPQAGRYREFWQFGCEQIGAGTPVASAELIALAHDCIAAAGLQGFELRVGHVGILRPLVAALGLDDDGQAAAMRAIDKGDLDGLRAAAAGADAVALDRLVAAWTATDMEGVHAATAGEPDVAAAVEELGAVLDLLPELGVDAAGPRIGIARGLDYYSGVVFEIHADALGAQSQLAGGGTYDLAAVFDGQSTPTMGFGIGFDRTLVALEAEGAEPAPVAGPAVYFGALSDAAWPQVLRMVSALRRRGVHVDQDLLGRKPGQIAKAADAVGARLLVMLGDKDLQAGSVAVKSLETGDAIDIGLDACVAWILEQVGAHDPRDFD